MNEQEEKQVQSCIQETFCDESVHPVMSKLAILSLVLGILSLFFFVLAGIPAIVIGIVSILRIRRSGSKLKGKYIALAGMNVSILFMYVFYLFWRVDAPPIPNDYTIADLRSAPSQYANSFDVFMSLIEQDQDVSDYPAIELSNSDRDMIWELKEIIKRGTASEISKSLNDHAKEIRQIWTDNKIARDVIRRLNKFPEIADLTVPSIDSRIMYRPDIIKLTHLYQIYAYLQTEQNDIHSVTVQLIELDYVHRKLSMNARSFIGKLICLMCIEEDMITANIIVNNPQTAIDSLNMIKGHFKTLTAEQLSLRNGVLFEYLLMKNIILDELAQSIKGKTPLLKSNSTLRLYRNYCDDWLGTIEQTGGITSTRFSVWPDYYPFGEPKLFRNGGVLSLIYGCYNPLGSLSLGVVGFHRNVNPKRIADIFAYEDIFRIVLNKRLGKEVSLKARAYSDEYIVDIENRKIFSPGLDGKTDTRDDIMLRINPEVLGW